MNKFTQSTKCSLVLLIFFTSALLLVLNACRSPLDQTSALQPSATASANVPESPQSVWTVSARFPPSTPQPIWTPTGSFPTSMPQLTQQYEFTAQDSGKTVTYTITSRLTIILNMQQYPKGNLLVTCRPAGALGSISNIPAEAYPLYAVRYEGTQAGICTIKNGTFLLTVKIIVPSSTIAPIETQSQAEG